MEQLPAAFLAEIARQIGFVSAFLGGFAATFLGTLLFAANDRRLSSYAIAASALSACSFIVAVLALTLLAVKLDPSAPGGGADSATLLHARLVGLLSFMLGMYALLATIGMSGWLRSRRLGWITTAIAVAAALLGTWTLTS